MDASIIGKIQKIKTQPLLSRMPKQQIDLEQVLTDDLHIIKNKDLFMFYSIPGVLDAEIQMEEIDASNLRNGVTCPGCVQRFQKMTTSKKAEPRMCVSYVCHPDLLLEDLLDEDDEILGLLMQ